MTRKEPLMTRKEPLMTRKELLMTRWLCLVVVAASVGCSKSSPDNTRESNANSSQAEASTDANPSQAEASTAAGYGKAIWGMYESEVLVAESKRISKLKKPSEYVDSDELLRIDGLKFANRDCYAAFLFDDKTKTLNQVKILFPLKSDNTQLLFKSLEELLSQKFGAPFYKSDEQIEKEGTLSWLNEGTTVTLDLIDIAGLMTKVSVSYKPLRPVASGQRR